MQKISTNKEKAMKSKVTLGLSVAAFFLIGLGISIFPGSEQLGQAQVQDSNETQVPKTKLPLGTKRGLEELKTLLEASEATNAPTIRKVVITVPKGLPERFRLGLGSSMAIAEFFLISDVNSLNLENFDPAKEPDLQGSEGKKALLPNGGTIRLRVRKIKENNNNQRSIGELHIKNHQIPGFEKVNQVELVTEEER